METGQYKDLFISEAQEILGSLNNSLVELEKRPQDVEILNDIFRHSHTLKGMAATMNYERITKLTHEMESVLDLLRNKKMTADKSTVSILFESFDILEELVEGVRTGLTKKVNEAIIIDKLNRLLPNVPVLEKKPFKERRMLRLEDEDRIAIGKEIKEGMTAYRTGISLAKTCQLKEARAVMALKVLETLGQVIRPDYIANQIKAGKYGRHFGLFFITKEQPDMVKKKIKEIPEVDNITLRPLGADEIILSEKEVPKEEANPLSHKPVEVHTIRVGIDKLDNLMDLVGELVINKIRLRKIGQVLANKELDEALAQMGRLTSDLQNEMMQVRLLPLEYIFNRFPRMVRDLAIKEKKEADLIINGSEIGLDRTILDEINDPLIHLLRNVITHGIEEPKERERLGKPQRGQVKLIAHRERNFVVIEVSDDGCGIDVEEIRKEAVRRKILSSEEVSKLSDEEAMMLITTPGFTITNKVTEAAGRGVGMNTVKTKVETIGGSLSIESKVGQGSRFILRLPLTMAIVQGLLVALADETYVIPLTNIAETIKVGPESIKTVEHHEIIPYRDTVLPLVRVREKLKFSSEPGIGSGISGRQSNKRIPIVVVEVGYKKAGFIVDALLGQQEVVIKTLTDPLKRMKGIAGATILGNGKVALILDIPSLI